MKKNLAVFFLSFFCLFTLSQICRIFINDNSVSQSLQASTLGGGPINYLPVGFLDNATISNAGNTGWTVDPNVPTQSIQIALFIDTTKTVAGTSFVNVATNLPRPDVTKVFPAYTGNHGFTYTIPTQYQDGKIHNLYAYGIDAQTGAYQPLVGSPKTFTITAPQTNLYNVFAKAGAGGTIIPVGTTTVPKTYVVNCIITPSKGYQIATILVDGKSWTNNSSPQDQVIYSFPNISANHTISVTFATSTLIVQQPASTTPIPTPAPQPPTNTTPISFDPNQPFIPASSIATTNLSSSGAVLSWPKVTGAVGYGVYLDNVLLDTTTATSYDTSGILMPDTDYALNIESLTNLNQVDGAIAIIPTKPLGFWASIWSGLLAAVGASTQPVVTTESIHTLVAPPMPVKGTAQVLAVLFKFLDTPNSTNLDGTLPKPTATLDTPAAVKDALFDNKYSASAFYKENSINQLNEAQLNIVGDVYPQVISLNGYQPNAVINATWENMPKITMQSYVSNFKNNPTLTNVPLYESINQQLIKAGYQLRYLGTDGQYHDKLIVYVWPLNNKVYGGASDGIGLVGGDIKGRIWINGQEPANVYAHEIGHKLGFNHADAIVCNLSDFTLSSAFGNHPYFCNYQNFVQYGDPVNVMDGGQGYFHVNQYNKSSVGWIPSVPINQSGSYSLFADEIKQTTALHFPKNDTGDEYYLEYRQKIGFDSTLSDNQVSGVSLDILNQHIFKTLSQSGLQDTDVTGDTFKIGTTNQNGVSSSLYLANGGVFEDPINHIRVIQLSHDTTKANVFVRLDTTLKPVVSAISETVKNQPNNYYTGKVDLSWTAVPGATGSTIGYEVYRDATATSSLIYSGANTSYVDTVSAGSAHLYYVRAYDSFTELPGKKYYLAFSSATFGGSSFGMMSNVVYSSTPRSRLTLIPINTACSANTGDLYAQTAFYDVANTSQYYKTNKPCSTFDSISWQEGANILTGTIKLLPNGPTIYYDQPGKGTGYMEYYADINGNSVGKPTPGGSTYYYFSYPATGLSVVK